MLNLLEELGMTVSELVGAALVFSGFAGVVVALSKFGSYFMQLLVG